MSTIATSAVTPGVQEAVTILTELTNDRREVQALNAREEPLEQTLMKQNFRIIGRCMAISHDD